MKDNKIKDGKEGEKKNGRRMFEKARINVFRKGGEAYFPIEFTKF